MTHAVRLTIKGKVQGVGYRAWFAETLSAFIKSCWQGPSGARVDRVVDEAYTGLLSSDFKILPTV